MKIRNGKKGKLRVVGAEVAGGTLTLRTAGAAQQVVFDSAKERIALACKLLGPIPIVELQKSPTLVTYAKMIATEGVVEIVMPEQKTKPLTGKYMQSVGFTGHVVETVQCYKVGPPNGTLYIFEGYTTGQEVSWWACMGKYTNPFDAARTCPHFEKRLRTEADLHQLVDALGIKLK